MFRDRDTWNSDNDLFWGKEISEEELKRREEEDRKYTETVLQRALEVCKGYNDVPFADECGWDTVPIDFLEKGIRESQVDDLRDFEKSGVLNYDGGYFDLSMLGKELPAPEPPEVDEETLEWLKEMGMR